jgi:hypothetical protein
MKPPSRRPFNAGGATNKYRAQATLVDGIRFASKAEARRYGELCLARQTGLVKYFLRQVPLHLPLAFKYVVDFVVFWANGDVTYEEVKGCRTQLYRLKKRSVEMYYPIKITEISYGDRT